MDVGKSFQVRTGEKRPRQKQAMVLRTKHGAVLADTPKGTFSESDIQYRRCSHLIHSSEVSQRSHRRGESNVHHARTCSRTYAWPPEEVQADVSGEITGAKQRATAEFAAPGGTGLDRINCGRLFRHRLHWRLVTAALVVSLPRSNELDRQKGL